MTNAKRKIPTADQVLQQQARDHEVGGIYAPKPPAPGTAMAIKAAVPAAVSVPDQRGAIQDYLDEIAPNTIVGRMLKFDGKAGVYKTHDDGQPIASDLEFVAHCDQTLGGLIRFNGEGEPPTRHMGLIFEGYRPPPREALGDLDRDLWPIGLDNLPQDVWQHHVYLVLQETKTLEFYTFVTSSKTGRRAAGNLLRHYERVRKTHPDDLPVVKLGVGGFFHADTRVGWVPTPVFTVVGRRSRDSAAKPDTSVGADMNDAVGF